MTFPKGTIATLGALIGAWTASLAIPAHADDTCQLQQAIELPMTELRDGHVSVPMTIGDRPVKMLVDTGGLFSMLTPPTVAALDLHKEIIPLSRIQQYGGLTIDHYVTAHDVSLGGIKGYKFDFLVMPEHGYSSDIDGLLAPDIMRNYDADFDFANHMFRLFSPEHCEGKVVYWTHDPYGTVEFRLNEFGQMTVPIMLDGHEIRAMIDTGAYRSTASLETIEDDFDIDEKNPELHLLPGAGPDHLRYHYPFKTLSLQSITVNNPDIVLVPDAQSGLRSSAPRMLLGINVLRQLHLYIAYHEHTLYVTPAAAH